MGFWADSKKNKLGWWAFLEISQASDAALPAIHAGQGAKASGHRAEAYMRSSGVCRMASGHGDSSVDGYSNEELD